MQKIILLLVLGFAPVSFASFPDPAGCMRKEIDGFIASTGLTMIPSKVDYQAVTYQKTSYEETVHTFRGKTKRSTRVTDKSSGISKILYAVDAQSADGKVKFRFGFEAGFFKAEKTKFGSGTAETSYHCGIKVREIEVTELNTRFGKKFAVPRENSLDAKMEAAEKAAEAAGEIARFEVSSEQYCQAHGKQAKSSSKRELDDFYENDDAESQYHSTDYTIYKYHGCQHDPAPKK